MAGFIVPNDIINYFNGIGMRLRATWRWPFFEFTNFWNNGFEAPQGVSITPFDPNFVDLKNGDYHLTETSPCIGIGTLKNAPQIDFDGQKRNKEQIDLGPFMFN